MTKWLPQCVNSGMRTQCFKVCTHPYCNRAAGLRAQPNVTMIITCGGTECLCSPLTQNRYSTVCSADTWINQNEFSKLEGSHWLSFSFFSFLSFFCIFCIILYYLSLLLRRKKHFQLLSIIHSSTATHVKHMLSSILYYIRNWKNSDQS